MAMRKQSQSRDGETVVGQIIGQKTTQKPIDVGEAFNILDRVIGFINNCDNKASIVLGGIAAILAIVFSGNGIERVIDVVSAIVFSAPSSNRTIGEVAYLTLLILSVILLTVGLVFLILTITARIKSGKSSVIYFGHIARLENDAAYKERVVSISEEELLEDILAQIYINSVICDRKYKYYNRGLKLTVIGFIALVAILAISVFGR